MKYSVEIKQKAIEYYLVGYSAQKISTIIGVNEATIRKWLKENNINIRNGGSYNKIYNDEFINKVKNLYDEGFNSIEITKMLGLKRGIVSYLLRENGYKLNHRGPKSKMEEKIILII